MCVGVLGNDRMGTEPRGLKKKKTRERKAGEERAREGETDSERGQEGFESMVSKSDCDDEHRGSTGGVWAAD